MEQQKDADQVVVSEMLRRAFLDAAAAVDREDSIDRAEPLIEKFLELAKAHPPQRSFLVDLLMLALVQVRGGGEVVRYCMHELRWPEVRDRLLSMKWEAKSESDRWVISDILDAFEPNWRDANLFRRFREA